MQLILQRQLRGDCAKRRTVGRFPLESLDHVLKVSAHLASLLEPSAWRRLTAQQRAASPLFLASVGTPKRS